jgi:fructuronate reductase
MGERLSNPTLKGLPTAVQKPAYDRAVVTPGIVHLGLGAFHRAHQAVYVDDCLGAGETGWGIIGASLRSSDTRDALGPQDGLYTLAVRSGDTESLRVVGSIVSQLVAPESPAALLDAMTDPRTRIVTLTVTEKAYLRNAAGDLDAAHPDIVADLANPGAPRTVHGFLLEALARRRAAGSQPFTVLCCDNLPANGATLRRLLLQFAELREAELARFVRAEVAFPSSMVDRIVPATTDPDRARIATELGVTDAWPVMTEPFCQWVIEDYFPAGRPRWENFGATMVRDVTPFEDMKLRLLNGAHSGIAYLGLLSGHATVAAAFADPAIREFVDGLWAEAIPTLPEGAGLDPQTYIGELADRFANAALAHRTAQIANDGSQKLPQRIVASALERVAAGVPADHLMLVVAAWIAAAAARGNKLPAAHFTDPLDEGLAAIFSSKLSARETVDSVFDLAGFAKGSAHRGPLAEIAAAHLETLQNSGPAAAMAALADNGVRP